MTVVILWGRPYGVARPDWADTKVRPYDWTGMRILREILEDIQ
jgi:hypothetical protein